MLTVKEADDLLFTNTTKFGTEHLSLYNAAGRILAAPIIADRDIPPYNRVTMDGIAIRFQSFEKGIRSFKITATQAAGEPPIDTKEDNECIEIMTGAALSTSVDTVIRYEDITINNGLALLKIASVLKGQNIQAKGIDRKEEQVVVNDFTIISPAVIATAASVGATKLLVTKLPKISIIATGDELVSPDEIPLPYQIRTSNIFAINSLLNQHGINADYLQLRDDVQVIKQGLKERLIQDDVLLISGGVSAGKFDHLPQVLKELEVKEIFHKIAQRPGKPFWFGKSADGPFVFAFPGNPVSSFLCMIRYFIPWLHGCLGKQKLHQPFALLEEDIFFPAPLQYFIPVKITIDEEARQRAFPIRGNGSGDYLQLLDADAFMELPMDKNSFKKGEVYKIWPFRNVLL